ncbi:MAG: signal peptide peptidase SppA [Thermoanaerobaculia bacterium]
MRRLLLLFLLLVGLAVAIAVVAVLLSGGGPTRTFASGPTVLSLTLSEPLADYAPEPTLPFLKLQPRQSLATIYRAVRRARSDERVHAVRFYVQRASMGFGQAQELHRLLVSLRDSGKSLHCYLEGAGEGTNGTLAYYLVTACPRISLTPASDVNLIGIHVDAPFLRGALDKLRIEPDFDHIGRYKSAAESFTRTDHSEASREALDGILDDLYGQIVDAVAEARDLAPERVRELVDHGPYTAEEALAAGLVDEIAYPDEFEQGIRDEVGENAVMSTTEDYAPDPGRRGGLAVVFAQGTIVRGGNGLDPWTRERYIGSDDLGRLLADLTDDEAIQAVVLRVDSPGGSALASELILRRAQTLAEAKPLVVSMSSLAASGGYYISCAARSIVAEAGTLTGSIGVVGGKLATRTFQQELLGITHDTLQRGANADFYSALDTFTAEQAETYHRQMETVYERFVGHVAEGRAMSREAVAAVAEGRVWSGERAVDIGLVDEIGGLDRALEIAAAGAEIDLASAGITYYPSPPSLLDWIENDGLPGLSVDPAQLLRSLGPRPPRTLELPPDLARLARSF